MNGKTTRKKYPVTVGKCPNGHTTINLPDDVTETCKVIGSDLQNAPLFAALAGRAESITKMQQAIGWIEQGLHLALRERPDDDALLFELATARQIMMVAVGRAAQILARGLTPLDVLNAAAPHMIEVKLDA